MNKKRPRNFDYPEKTKGSELADKARSETNNLTKAEREELLKRGMEIIYHRANKLQT